MFLIMMMMRWHSKDTPTLHPTFLDDDIRNVGCNVVVIMSDDDDIASNISNHDDLFLHWQNNCNAREVQTKEDASAAADLCKVCLQSQCDRVVLVP